MAKNESIIEAARRLSDQMKKDEAVRVTIALFGQPGSGKSSLINRLVGQNLAPVGVATDQTVKASAYEYNGVHLVDLPGLDTRRFPKETFWRDFHLDTFDLFLCVFSEKLGAAEADMFRLLHEKGKICLFVRNKRDVLWDEHKSVDALTAEIARDVKLQVHSDVSVFFTSCRDGFGLGELSTAIAVHLEGAKQSRWIEGAKAYTEEFLEKKREIAKKKVKVNAFLSAANAVNPIPGADLAVDISILLSTFRAIRASYGLTDQSILTAREFGIPALGQLAGNIVKFSTREGVLSLLQRFLGRTLTAEAAKFVPLLGQAVAATAGFSITYAAGSSFLNDCHEMAEAILSRELARHR
ncbi:MAG: GTPase [Thermodesulfobacteriota bacterium]